MIKKYKTLIISIGPANGNVHGTVDGLTTSGITDTFEHIYYTSFYQNDCKILTDKNVSIVFGNILSGKLSKSIFINPIKIIDYVRFVQYLKQLILTEHITVIQSADPHICGLTAFILSKSTSRRFLITLWNSFDLIHKHAGWTTSGLPRFIEKIIERFIYKTADMIVGMNDDLVKYAISKGTKIDKCGLLKIIVNPIHYDTNHEDIKPQLTDGKLITFVGRLSPENFVLDMLKVFDIIRSKRDDVKLCIVGTGPQEDQVIHFIKQYNLDDNVIMLGQCDQNYIKNLYYASDVVLCPLSGNVLVEASLAGRPIVAYDIDWHSELIKDNYSGFLIKFSDYNHFAHRVIQLLDDVKISWMFGERAKAYAMSMHNAEYMKHERMRLISKMLKR